MIDKKKIIKIQCWEREDYREEVYYLEKQVDVIKVRDYIKKLRIKYWVNYTDYQARNWIKQYITRTLHWICLSDFWRDFNINYEKIWDAKNVIT